MLRGLRIFRARLAMHEFHSRNRFPIVGVGASAGGLHALEKFFGEIPADAGMSFVVITHQQPGHHSLLPELLSRVARIPVTPAEAGLPVAIDHVYVAPPSVFVSMHGQQLQLQAMVPSDPRLPVDHFFRSLAETQLEHAIGIILSGMGSDGTLGIMEIKANAGLVIAQDPETAQYKGMPQSAIATRKVDYVLAPERMAARLQEFSRSRYALPPEDLNAQANSGLLKVLTTLRSRTHHDFTGYKKSTIRRRIQRRMNLQGIGDSDDYAAFLERTPLEVEQLFKELLISVTSFFRDPEAFVALERWMTPILERKSDHDTLRGWIPGCATGEEAYSIAILLREMLQRASKHVKVQLFATDLDSYAIDVARAGCYPEGIGADVTRERLEQFFSKEEGRYRVNRDIRESVIFATQNLIRDPPFTKLDLVSCRNLLIYLEPELQRRVSQVLGYSLRADGLLLLGASEGMSGFDAHFTVVDKRWKIFRRREFQANGLSLPDLDSGRRFEWHAAKAGGLSEPRLTGGHMIERALLSALAPPTIVVSQRGEIIYFHGRTGAFLEPATGEPSNNLLHMVRPGLHIELPSALRQAQLQEAPVVRHGLRIKTEAGLNHVRLTVRKLQEPEPLRGTFMISFELEAAPEADTASSETDETTEDKLAGLEHELQRTRDDLQGTIEELANSNEELKSTNEELQSTNEELQSTNEELETSREEMQSLNEELQAVNVELAQRNLALSEANDDMQNLLNSVGVATLFLDNKLHIKRFTTQARKVFSLIDSDVGRPISDLSANLRHDQLLDDARDVLQTLRAHEEEIQTKDGAWQLMRIMPYRTNVDAIDGLVLTFTDIDRLKRGGQEQHQARVRAESVIDALPTPILVLDSELVVISANAAFHARFRTSAKHLIGEPFDRVVDESAQGEQAVLMLRRMLREGLESQQFHVSGSFSRFGTGDFVVTAHVLQSPELRHVMLSISDRELPQAAPPASTL